MSKEPPPIRVALVEDRMEDHKPLIALLRSSPDFECVAICRSGADARGTLPACKPDVVLMDINMPGQSGIQCVSQLRSLLPRTQFMMLTVYEDHDAIFRSLAAGATGYLLKKTPPAEILEAVRELLVGGAPMSGQIARKVVTAFRQPSSSSASTSANPEAQLSPVEQSVLQRLARGLLYKEVAAELNISLSTVRTHVWHIYRKLQVHNRTEAILKGTSGQT